MKDRELLILVHQILTDAYNENHLLQHMHQLRELIHETPKDRKSVSDTVNMKSNCVYDEINKTELSKQ